MISSFPVYQVNPEFGNVVRFFGGAYADTSYRVLSLFRLLLKRPLHYTCIPKPRINSIHHTTPV